MVRISVPLFASALLLCSVLPSAGQQKVKADTPKGNALPPSPCASITSDGTAVANKVTKFTAPCNIEPSKMTDSGTSVSIGELLSLPATGAATATGGKNSQAMNFTASAFKSGTSTAVNQNFRLQGEPVNNNTTTASGSLNVLFGQGTATPVETGISFSKTGNLSARRFTSTVPTGTAPLTVTSTTLVPNLNASLLGSLSSSAFAKLNANNNFAGNQTITGNLGVLAGVVSGNGSGLSSVNAALLNGFSSGAFAFVGSSNNFNGNQSVTGNISATGSVTAASFSGNGSGLTGVSVGYSATIPPGTDTTIGTTFTLVAQTNVVGTSGTYFISASAMPFIKTGDSYVFCFDTLASSGSPSQYGAGYGSGVYVNPSITDALFVGAGDSVQLWCYAGGNNGSLAFNAGITATLINNHSPLRAQKRQPLRPRVRPEQVQ